MAIIGDLTDLKLVRVYAMEFTLLIIYNAKFGMINNVSLI